MNLFIDLLGTSFVSPFTEYAFMRRALLASLALAISAAPLGVLLSLRRMSLMGDALSHAILPGVALAYMLMGVSLGAMVVGGVISGVLVASLAGATSRFTVLKEDASLAAVYLLALALGVALVSAQGTQLDLLHLLFGSALSVDTPGLVLVASVSTMTLLALALFFRGWVLESFDPAALASKSYGGMQRWLWQQGFFLLVILNLVSAFQALGTLMAVGLMMIPAVSARLWHSTLAPQCINAAVQASVAAISGLLVSYHFNTPSGPSIIACAGALYLTSLGLAPGGYWARRTRTTPSEKF